MKLDNVTCLNRGGTEVPCSHGFPLRTWLNVLKITIIAVVAGTIGGEAEADFPVWLFPGACWLQLIARCRLAARRFVCAFGACALPGTPI